MIGVSRVPGVGQTVTLTVIVTVTVAGAGTEGFVGSDENGVTSAAGGGGETGEGAGVESSSNGCESIGGI